MKQLLLIFTILLLLSCEPSSTNQWKTATELNGTWIKIERDEQGYLYYEPCDSGYTSTLKFDDNQMLFDSGHEGPDSLSIVLVELKNMQTELHFIGSNNYHSIKGILKKIPDDEKLFLLTWDFIVDNDGNTELKNKMMMTRLDYKPQFRFVDNPCPTERKREKKFLPIEF